MNTVKAYGDYSVRLEGSALTAYLRGINTPAARKYYASPESAERAYKNIRSGQSIESFITRNQPSGLRVTYTWMGGQALGIAGYAASLYTKSGRHIYDGPIEPSKKKARIAAVIDAKQQGLLSQKNPKREKNPVKSSTFSNLGKRQKQMLNFMIRNGPSKIYSIARDAETRSVAESLRKRGIITITNRAVESWQIRFTAAGRAWAKRRKRA